MLLSILPLQKNENIRKLICPCCDNNANANQFMGLTQFNQISNFKAIQSNGTDTFKSQFSSESEKQSCQQEVVDIPFINSSTQQKLNKSPTQLDQKNRMKSNSEASSQSFLSEDLKGDREEFILIGQSTTKKKKSLSTFTHT